jgi:hypothetical protein
MKLIEAQLLKPATLLVARDRIIRIGEVTKDHGIVKVTGANVLTGERETTSMAWDTIVSTDFTYHRNIEGLDEREGTLEVELCSPKQGYDDSWDYRYRILNRYDVVIDEGTELRDPPASRTPNARRAAQALVSFLLAAAESQESVDRGNETDNHMFNEETMRWAADNTVGLQIAELEMTEAQVNYGDFGV